MSIKKINRWISSIYTINKNTTTIRDKSLYVFGSWWGNKFADNSKYLYLYYISQKKNAVWITKSKTIYDEMRKNNLPVYMSDSEEGIDCCKKANYVFFSTSIADVNELYVGGATLINLWHGVPLKKIMYDDLYHKEMIGSKIWNMLTKKAFEKQYIISTSETYRKIYSSAFRFDIQHILSLGQPRNDAFFDGSIQKKHYTTVPYKKMILYLPTHRNSGKTQIDIDKIFDLKMLDSFCKENEILFVIKKHFYHKSEKCDLSNYSNITDFTGIDIDTQELMYNSYALITDYSSCFIDYLLLDRPMFFYCYDYELYIEKDRDMYFDYNDIIPGYKACNFSSLLSGLKSTINGIYPSIKKQNIVKSIFYDKDNQFNVCEKIMKKVSEL